MNLHPDKVVSFTVVMSCNTEERNIGDIQQITRLMGYGFTATVARYSTLETSTRTVTESLQGR